MQRRHVEAGRSNAIIGTHRVEWLGYADSGMSGWSQNDHDDSFTRADTEEAAERVAAILRGERADVLVGYDWHGGYGHPDHVKVHAVAKRAAELTGIPAAAWAYRLGNRSAIDWVLDQHREKTPRDPTVARLFNTYRFADHKEAMIDLLARVVRVSVDTVAITESMRARSDASPS